MSRRVLYVAAPLRPTEDEIDNARHSPGLWTGKYGEDFASIALRANLDRAMRWLAWLRRSFPETTFIAPWIATVLSLDGDDSPALREAGLVDDCAVVERCDGIVLVGGRISEGMRREMEHGLKNGRWLVDDNGAVFSVYSLADLTEPPLGVPVFAFEENGRPTFADYMAAHEDS